MWEKLLRKIHGLTKGDIIECDETPYPKYSPPIEQEPIPLPDKEPEPEPEQEPESMPEPPTRNPNRVR